MTTSYNSIVTLGYFGLNDVTILYDRLLTSKSNSTIVSSFGPILLLKMNSFLVFFKSLPNSAKTMADAIVVFPEPTEPPLSLFSPCIYHMPLKSE